MLDEVRNAFGVSSKTWWHSTQGSQDDSSGVIFGSEKLPGSERAYYLMSPFWNIHFLNGNLEILVILSNFQLFQFQEVLFFLPDSKRPPASVANARLKLSLRQRNDGVVSSHLNLPHRDPHSGNGSQFAGWRLSDFTWFWAQNQSRGNAKNNRIDDKYVPKTVSPWF